MSTNLDIMRIHNQRLRRASALWVSGKDSISIAKHLMVLESWVWRNMEAIKLVAKQRKAA